jgi:hypothetical protein
MAKRTPKTPKTDPPTAVTETPRKVGSPAKTRARRAVASEMATGQDQAAAASDEFVGVPNQEEEPVQAGGGGYADSSVTESVSMSSEPNAEDIRMRAYHRYLERGGGHGMDFEDWLEAERDLKAPR